MTEPGKSSKPDEPGRPVEPIEPVELKVAGARLRPPSITDAPAVLALAQDPDVRMWNPRCRIEDARAAVATCVADADWSAGSHATFSIIEASTGTYAGTIALHDIDRAAGEARVGYRIATWTRGRGLATAAVRAVTEWAAPALGLNRIVLTHAVGNTASCRVAQKAGFELHDVTAASKVFGDGIPHDEHVHVQLH